MGNAEVETNEEVGFEGSELGIRIQRLLSMIGKRKGADQISLLNTSRLWHRKGSDVVRIEEEGKRTHGPWDSLESFVPLSLGLLPLPDQDGESAQL